MNYLLVEVSTEQHVIPLSQIIRLEEFEIAQVEYSGVNQVIQYRGEIMVLKRLNEGGDQASLAERKLQVVVVPGESRKVGLVVDRIVDIVHVDQNDGDVAGATSKTVIVNKRVTSCLDVSSLVV